MLHAGFIGVLNGIIGDHLASSGNSLAIEMDFHHREQALKGQLHSLKADYPDVNATACIYLHGSADTEKGWHRSPDINYIQRLYGCFGILPLTLRYNSGLSISDNGKALAGLLSSYLSSNEIRNVIVIGHSMGGLLFRSACHHAAGPEYSWTEKVTHVFYLGSPHHGAPLEKLGAWANSILKKVDTPYTNAGAKLLNLRSKGIKDLRNGRITDEDNLRKRKNKKSFMHDGQIPGLANAKHFAVAATIGKDPNSVLSKWAGDLMVRKSSALGKGRQANRFPEENTLHVGGLSHIRLTYSAEVIDFIESKLAEYYEKRNATN